MVTLPAKCFICGNIRFKKLFSHLGNNVYECTKCRLGVSVFKKRNQEYEDISGYVTRTAVFERYFNAHLDLIEKYVKRGKLLDVGCSVGLWMDTARKRGFEVFGIDSSREAINFARKELRLNVKRGEFERMGFGRQKFNLIVLNHVLEHMENPVGVLKKSYKLLLSGGIVFVGLPNKASLLSKIQKENWWGWRLGDHHWHFQKENVFKILKLAGFEALYCRSCSTPFEPYVSLKKRMKEVAMAICDYWGAGNGIMAIGKRDS